MIFWLAIAYWVYKDARRRIEDPWLVAMATLLGLVPPFFGALVYMLFRPPEYLEDIRERDLEIRELEERMSRFELRCPVCRAAIDPSYLVCPVCTTKLKQACETLQRAARAALAGLPVLREADRADADADLGPPDEPRRRRSPSRSRTTPQPDE